MKNAPSGDVLVPSGDDQMAADVVCTAGGGPTTIQQATVNLPKRRQVMVTAEVHGRFAAAGPGEVDFQLEVDGVPLTALAGGDDTIGIQKVTTYAQQDAAADEVVPVSLHRILVLEPGARVISLTGSATTQGYEVNGNTDSEHGSSVLIQDFGTPPT